MNPGGGLGADIPRPGGGRGMVEDGAGAEAFIGKEVLKPEKQRVWTLNDAVPTLKNSSQGFNYKTNTAVFKQNAYLWGIYTVLQ